LITSDHRLLAIRRGGGFTCVTNFTDEPLPLPLPVREDRRLIQSTPDAVDATGRLAANCTVWLLAG
jgi:hypothetical protein